MFKNRSLNKKSPLCRNDCYHDKNKSNYMENDYSNVEVIKKLK